MLQPLISPFLAAILVAALGWFVGWSIATLAMAVGALALIYALAFFSLRRSSAQPRALPARVVFALAALAALGTWACLPDFREIAFACVITVVSAVLLLLARARPAARAPLLAATAALLAVESIYLVSFAQSGPAARAIDAHALPMTAAADRFTTPRNLARPGFQHPLAISATARIVTAAPERPSTSLEEDLSWAMGYLVERAQSGDMTAIRALSASTPDALASALEAVSHSPDVNGFPTTHFAVVSFALGRHQAAETAYRRVLEANPRSRRSLAHLLAILRRQGRSNEAMDLAAIDLERSGNGSINALARIDYAARERNRGNVVRARELLDDVLTRETQPLVRAKAELWLGILELDQQDDVAAIEHLKTSLAHSADFKHIAVQTDYYLGAIAIRQNDNAGAEFHLNRSVESARSLHDKMAIGTALFLLSIVYDKTGRLDQAEAAATEALALFDNIKLDELRGQALHLLGTFAHKRGDPNKAESLMNAALEAFAKVGDEKSQELVRKSIDALRGKSDG